jgi:CheY-like chemotaxis protein
MSIPIPSLCIVIICLNNNLVIDDEVDFLQLVKFNLEETNNYEVLTLPGANDILVQVQLFNPDIILLDILMPGAKGIEACEILNKDYKARNIPVVVLSNLDKETDKLKAYKVGVVAYLNKPVGKDEPIAKLENILKDKLGN